MHSKSSPIASRRSSGTVYPAVEKVQEMLGDVQDATVGLGRLAGLRDRLKQTLPQEWPRLRQGFEGAHELLAFQDSADGRRSRSGVGNGRN